MAAEQFDLIVVGGGPAGSSLAAFVAQQGHRVLLLEKEKFPRYQIGESLLPSTVQGICKLLGVYEEIHQAGFTTKNGGTLKWGRSPEPWTFNFRDTPLLGGAFGRGYAFQVERAKFDNILLQNAKRKGAVVREQQTVRGVIEENGRVVGLRYEDETGQPREVRGRYVADASGNTGTLYTHVGERVWSKFFRNLAIFAYWRGGKRLPAPNQGNILTAAFKEGWFWYIPLTHNSDLTSVGAVVPVESADRIRELGHEKAYLEFIRQSPIISEYLANAQRIEDHELYGKIRIRRDWSYMNSRFWRPGMVLLGDTACFVDPLLSSGVHLATYSALLASRSINTFLRGEVNEERCMEEYEKRYRKEYGVFYDFLLSFYDMEQEVESYFWAARKVINTEEKANEQFIRLVAGSTSAHEFFQDREGIGSRMAETHRETDDAPKPDDIIDGYHDVRSQILAQANQGDQRPREKPMFPGGLVATDDGFRWMEHPIELSSEAR
ncbi:tryptophan 7-halogenase [Hyalangium minutum]|uniref:FAD-binding protein n=1 Tax=Hyalangium minutum TaxID=394096 RepID=A0A085WL02_9BACT|nr:tryptophan 7-halogenase [Hyalangium minutum]KFE68365.1 FAD-binding protein [Hyalangium minutum]